MTRGQKKTRAPKLRFPEFRDTVYWKEQELGEICEILNGQRVPIPSDDRRSGPYPYYGASGIVDYVDDYLFDERLVLVGEDGAKWGAFERTAFIAEGMYWVNNHAHVLKCVGVIDTLLQHYLTMMDISTYITGYAPPKLTLGKLKSIPIPVPVSLAEQRRIADCLTSLDVLLAAEGRKLAALRTHKKGLMQQLFPRQGESRPRLRFPEFRDAREWDSRKLGELGEVATGKTPSTGDSSLWDGNILFITPTDIVEGAKYQHTTRRHVAGTGARVLPVGSIVYTCIASIGKMAITSRPSVTNQQINALTAHKNVVGEYVYYALKLLTPRIKSMAASSTLSIINKGDFEEICIPVPFDTAEQQRIADCLSSLGALVAAASRKLDALRTHKKGLMQQLFPSPDGE